MGKIYEGMFGSGGKKINNTYMGKFFVFHNFGFKKFLSLSFLSYYVIYYVMSSSLI